MKGFCWLCAVLLCPGVAAHAQKTVTVPAVAAEKQNSAGPITLDVVVTDKAGHPVTGLQQQDFKLLDDRQPVPILSFKAHDNPSPQSTSTRLILVVDDVNANFQAVSTERIEIDKFLRGNQGHLPVPTSLAILTDRGFSEIRQPSTDGNLLSASLDQHQAQLRDIGRSAGFYGGAERLQMSLRALDVFARYEETLPGRKLVVWISPGWWIFDNPNVMFSTRQQRNFFGMIVNLSTSLRRARVVLYSVDPLGMADAAGFRTFLWKNYLKPVRSPGQADVGDLALQVLATESGGKALSGSNDIAAQIALCAEDAAAWYTLTFDPAKSETADTWHDLQVKVDKPGVVVRTRNGYYAQP